MLFAARTNVAFTDAMPQLLAVLAKDKARQYEVLAKLGPLGYGFAGRWAEGEAAIDQAVKVAGSTVPPQDPPRLRYAQATFAAPLDAPDQAAAFAKQVLDALPPCGTKCSDKDKDDVVQALYGMGRLFHGVYATSDDQRYFQPAHDLYTMTAPIIMAADV